MKVVFLDVDGVLNCRYSKSTINGCIGIDKSKVKRLKRIAKESGAKIVLISSWKYGWSKREEDKDSFAKYLDSKLKKENIFIYDKTTDNEADRGHGIIEWLKGKRVTSWVVLDDEEFEDYSEYGIVGHLVKTSFYDERGGLQDEHVEKALLILNKDGEIRKNGEE